MFSITARKLAMILKGLRESGLEIQKLRIDPAGVIEATVGSTEATAEDDIDARLDKRLAEMESARPGRKPRASAEILKLVKERPS